ncbi:MAG: SprB repeat-containing protein, partial [Flavobacteriales bacterium]
TAPAAVGPQASGTFSGLTGTVAGTTYTIQVTDAAGCTDNIPQIITEPLPLIISVDAFTNESCDYSDNGTLTVSATGGTGAYSFDITSPITSTNTTGSFVGLTGTVTGTTYTIEVTDGNGCTDQITQVITEPTPLVIGLTPSITTAPYNVSGCVDDGTITTAISGGSGGYTFDWNIDGTGDFNDSQNLTTLGQGLYIVTASDVNGCLIEDSIYLDAPDVVVITEFSSPTVNGGTNISCFGGSDGTINLTAIGGSTPYVYTWTTVGGSGINPGSEDQFGTLTAGSYSVIVTDQDGCNVDTTITLTQPQPILITIAGDAILCNGDASGNVTGTITGGTAPYVIT